MHIEIEREEDGRFTAEVMELPGVIVTEATRDEAITAVKALAFRVIAAFFRRELKVGGSILAAWRVARLLG